MILKGGQGTVVSLADYEPASFEQALNAHPKIVIKING